MAGLCWMAVTLAFFLSAENTLAVDQNRLATFVNGILGKYRTQSMFSLAVSIPEDQNRRPTDILKKVYESDPSNGVVNTINSDQVYTGNRVVAARVLKQARGPTDHAESRVVDHLNDLFNPNNKNDLLLFYVYASPCVEKCTNQGKTENILERITALNNWNSYAFVFSKIFKPRNGQSNTEEELRGALTRLGSVIGLGNIFRCDRRAGRMQCISCSINGQVTHACVSDDDSLSGPSRSQPQQGSSGTAQGVQSRSGRYRRSGGVNVGVGWGHNGQGGHNGGVNVGVGWGRHGQGRHNGGVNVGVGWGRHGQGRHNGGVNVGVGWGHNGQGGHNGGVNVGVGWGRHGQGGHNGGVNVGVGWGHNGQGGHNGGVNVGVGWGRHGQGGHNGGVNVGVGWGRHGQGGHHGGVNVGVGWGRN